MAHSSRAFPELAPTSSFDYATTRQTRQFGYAPGAVVRGRAAVIGMRPLLVKLAKQTGQAGVLDQIELLVKHPSALRKIPCLVLVGLREGVAAENARAEDVEGAGLLYEYRMAGLATGIYATDDVSGERTVLAHSSVRAHVAELVGRVLIAHGGSVSLVSFTDAPALGPRKPAVHDDECHVAVRVRTQSRDLKLGRTLDETLGALGRNTRRNFRRYRQRAEEDLGAVFEPWVQIGPEEFMELNRFSTNQVSDDEAAWRYHFATSSSQRLFAGMRDKDGKWLSVIVGTRHTDYTYIDWQVNRRGLPSYSLSTVMRSFLLEHESKIGTKRLQFKGGTPHSMGFSLTPAETMDVIVVRRGVRGWLVRTLAHKLFPASNFLGRALDDSSLNWIA